MSDSKLTPEVVLPTVVPKPLARMWCHLKSELIKIDFEWTIDNFTFKEKTQSQMKSAEMSTEGFPDVKWSMEVMQHITSNVSYISLYLVSNAINSVSLRAKPAIVNKKGEKIYFGDYYSTLKIGTNNKLLLINYIAVSRISSENLLSDAGHLTIFCEIEALSATKVLTGQSSDGKRLSCSNSLANIFEKLYENMNLSDVTFTTGGQQFQAHKLILVARSPVFAAMFQKETKETFTNHVDVLDVEPDVFQQVLRFIYTDRIDLTKTEELATEILAAADKYLLENLKSECEIYLKSKMSNENCIEFLLLADRHSADNLKQYAIDFFRRHPAQVMSSDNWTKVKENEAVRLCDLLKTVFGFNSV